MTGVKDAVEQLPNRTSVGRRTHPGRAVVGRLTGQVPDAVPDFDVPDVPQLLHAGYHVTYDDINGSGTPDPGEIAVEFDYSHPKCG